MPNKYILIKSSAVTSTLRTYSDSAVDMTVLRIPAADIEDADTELATIDDDNWAASITKSTIEGQTTDSIVLPKEAINA